MRGDYFFVQFCLQKFANFLVLQIFEENFVPKMHAKSSAHFPAILSPRYFAILCSAKKTRILTYFSANICANLCNAKEIEAQKIKANDSTPVQIFAQHSHKYIGLAKECQIKEQSQRRYHLFAIDYRLGTDGEH